MKEKEIFTMKEGWWVFWHVGEYGALHGYRRPSRVAALRSMGDEWQRNHPAFIAHVSRVSMGQPERKKRK